MSKGLEELKRMAYESACCRCQYYIGKKCTNSYECVWKTIEKELKEHEQHKAIEQELGIDFITLIKAISNGIWVKTKNDISKHLTVALKKRHPTKEYWLFYRPYSHVYLEDYGKTWALTREELER